MNSRENAFLKLDDATRVHYCDFIIMQNQHVKYAVRILNQSVANGRNNRMN
jgi:hypothetical protein